VKRLGILLILFGIGLSLLRVYEHLNAETVMTTVTAIEQVEGECRRRSGRTEPCALQKLTLQYLNQVNQEKQIGHFTPTFKTSLSPGSQLPMIIDHSRAGGLRPQSITGGWWYRLLLIFAGMLLVVIYSTRST
jgi:hypothetical protein